MTRHKIENKKGFILLAVIIQIFLLVNMIISNSYIIYQTNPLIENSKIEEKNEIEELINSGINLLIGFLSIKQIGIVSAAEEALWCCPKTKEGAICQNIPIGDSSVCAEEPLFVKCETTTQCKTGTCIDEEEGICSVGTKYTCEDNWDPLSINSISECVFGCCILDGGVSKEYMRQITCEKKRGNFDSSISQTECKMITGERGACVLDETECRFTTKEDCETTLRGVFYKDSLCSNPELGTECERPVSGGDIKTECKNNKVYFLDSCGNLANVYDYDKWNEADYWNFVQEPECSVNVLDDGTLDKDSAKNCGNCNGLNSICDSSSEAGINPDQGDYICKDLNCGKDDYFFEKFGRNPLNQESWCVYESYVGDSKDVVGSAYWLRYCDKGKIKTELCDEYRTKICAEKTIEEEGKKYSSARCRANEGWKCYLEEMEQYKFSEDGDILNENSIQQGNKEKCEKASSDCRLETVDTYIPPGKENTQDMYKIDMCVPKYPPGLKFWDASSNTDDLCEIINSASCTTQWVKYGDWECKGNCQCLEAEFDGKKPSGVSETYTDQMNDLCASLGDCGGYVNIKGVYTKNFKSFDIRSLNFKDYDITEEIGGKDRSLTIRGDIEGSKKNEYKTYAERVGEGDLPVYLTDAELSQFGGDPLEDIGYLGGEPTDYMQIFQYIAIGLGAVAGVLLLIETTTVSIPIVGWIIAAVAAVVEIILIIFGAFGWGDTKEIVVEFDCQPWQAPVNTDDCETCDDDPSIPCTEYKCKSLGSNCKIVTDVYESTNPLCVNAHPKDFIPPIISLDYIGEGYTAEELSSGVKIRDETGGCIQEFSHIDFSLKTKDEDGNREYARCIYDFEGETSAPSIINDYALIGEEFKEGNSYSISHIFDSRLPFLSNQHVSGISGEVGERQGEINMYVRCMDPNGNSNINEYVVNLCIKEGPDNTAANIIKYFPVDKSFISYGKNESYLKILLNEPADCKWSYDIDKSYEEMKDFNFCESYIGQVKSDWECITTLKNLVKTENKIYIKCKDQPWISELDYDGPWTEEDRNVNAESFSYNLYATQSELKIDSILPQGEIIVGGTISEIQLNVVTSGGADNGNAICKYEIIEPSLGQDFFFQTDSTNHNQPLNFLSGEYNILIKCEDEGSNKAEETAMLNIIVDSSPPQIVRAYKEGNNLKLITNEQSKCSYSVDRCFFDLESETSITTAFSTVHTTTWDPSITYHIKCKDIFGNINTECAKKIIPSSNQ